MAFNKYNLFIKTVLQNMSYYADHLAWQQRVNIETKQQNSVSDLFSPPQTNPMKQGYAYPELMDL